MVAPPSVTTSCMETTCQSTPYSVISHLLNTALEPWKMYNSGKIHPQHISDNTWMPVQCPSSDQVLMKHEKKPPIKQGCFDCYEFFACGHRSMLKQYTTLSTGQTSQSLNLWVMWKDSHYQEMTLRIHSWVKRQLTLNWHKKLSINC